MNPPHQRATALDARLDQQGRTQELEHVSSPADQRAGGGLLPQRPQHLDLGHHADDGGIDGQQQAVSGRGGAWCRRPSRPRGRPRPARPAARGPGSSGWPPAGRAGPPRAADRGARAGGQPGGRPSAPPPPPASQPSPAPRRAVSSARGEVVRTAGDHRLEEHVLGGEPVEDRLLGDLEHLGDGVERCGLVAPARKGAQGRVEDALLGR